MGVYGPALGRLPTSRGYFYYSSEVASNMFTFNNSSTKLVVNISPFKKKIFKYISSSIWSQIKNLNWTISYYQLLRNSLPYLNTIKAAIKKFWKKDECFQTLVCLFCAVSSVGCVDGREAKTNKLSQAGSVKNYRKHDDEGNIRSVFKNARRNWQDLPAEWNGDVRLQRR